MKKTIIVFLFLFSVGFLFPKEPVFAIEEDSIELKQNEIEKILKSLIPKLESERYFELDSLDAPEQASLLLSEKALQAEVGNYLLFDVPKDAVKDLLSVTVTLARLLMGDETAIGTIIGEIEKRSVDAAKEYAMDWLLQREIKAANGNLELNYPGADGKWHKAAFSYVIVQKPIDSESSQLAIEFLSPYTLEAPTMTASYQWEGGIDKIPPFILRAKGEVEKSERTYYGYKWIKGPEIDISFSEPVPKIEIEEKSIIQSWMDKITSFAEKTRKAIDNLQDMFKQVGGFFSRINPFAATVVPISIVPVDLSMEIDTEEIIQETPNISEEPEEKSRGPSSPELEEMQDMIDDITEQIDILNQKLAELGVEAEEGEIAAEDIKKIEQLQEEIGQKAVEIQTAAFVPPSSTNSRKPYMAGGDRNNSSKNQEPAWCDIVGESALDKIIFSEIAWMGDSESSSNEWIKLKNISDVYISLEEWQIFDKAKQIKISFDSDTGISAGESYLLQRTKDYTGALNDTDEALHLFDSVCNLQDFVEANPDWPAGDKDTRKIMKRNDDLSWYDDLDSLIDVETDSDNDAGSGTGAASGEIIINEVAWMGTKASSSDEWIELFNAGSESVDLLGWQVIFTPLVGDSRIIALETDSPSIGALGYFLMERTNDSTISDVGADYIYTGALNDECLSMELRDEAGNLIDKINCIDGSWPAGDKGGRISMERMGIDSWYPNNLITINGRDAESNNIWGTPKTENSVSVSPTEIITQLPFDDFDEITLPLISSPYIVKERIMAPEGKTLIIEPGVVLEFFDEYDGLIVEGTLRAVGNEQNKILFTSFQENPAPGDWDKLDFVNTSLNSELNNIILEYGGGGFGTPCSPDMAGIKIEQTDSVSVKNSIFKNNQGRGIYLVESSAIFDNIQVEDTVSCESSAFIYEGQGIAVEGEKSGPEIINSLIENNPAGIVIYENTVPNIRNNTFEQNEKPIIIYGGYPYFEGNRAENNDINGVYVYGSIGQDTSWQADLPYIMSGKSTVYEGNVLTIEPGAVVKFYGQYSGMVIEGDLIADNVLFTSFQENPAPGDWDKLDFVNTSLNSELNNIILEYGGGGFGTPCSSDMAGIRVEQGAISLVNSVIRNNQYNGVMFIDSDSILNNVAVNNTTFCKSDPHSYGGYGINVTGIPPDMENISFENNESCNFYLNGECYMDVVPMPEPIIPTETPSSNP